jgi:hypothetical protein
VRRCNTARPAERARPRKPVAGVDVHLPRPAALRRGDLAVSRRWRERPCSTATCRVRHDSRLPLAVGFDGRHRRLGEHVCAVPGTAMTLIMRGDPQGRVFSHRRRPDRRGERPVAAERRSARDGYTRLGGAVAIAEQIDAKYVATFTSSTSTTIFGYEVEWGPRPRFESAWVLGRSGVNAVGQRLLVRLTTRSRSCSPGRRIGVLFD